MKKNRLTTRIIATAMAAVCVISAGTAISAMSVSAAEIVVTAYGKTSYGYDWDYKADSTAAKITCTYDFKTSKYTFRATGSYAGTTNAVLKYATIDGKWHNIPIRFTTDKHLNVTGQQTGKEYITNTRRG